MSISNVTYAPNLTGPYTDRQDGSIVGHSADRPLAAGIGLSDFPDRLPGAEGLDKTLTAPKPSEDLSNVVDSASRTLALISSQQGVMDLYSIMEVLVLTAQSQRTTARQMRQTDYQIQTELQYAAAAQIREGAKVRFYAALANGICMVVGGAFTISGAKGDQKTDMWPHIGKGLGEIFPGIGKLAETTGGYYASEHDGKKAELEAVAGKYGQFASEANESMEQMLQAIRDALDKLKSLESSRQDTNRTISRSV